MKRPVGSAEGEVPLVEFEDKSFQGRFPTLYEYLTCDKWEDGTARATSTLLLFLDAGILKGCINDRAMSRSLFVGGSTLQSLLEAAEEALRAENPGWRVFKAQVRAGGRRK